ncbi:hypothetical protein DSCW_17830 [Desulfosarcina widdelii]|uniref:Uncharacterized protein n=1 Tax=Desulfosarcina widdelii TaxID=947919 RepID=A0A5K7YYA5_9BACT|nr:hypothetical protein [Desulfosarcina widdelii]BBO73464.1 hypothetical protein DSCW_08810 [Desulfosarcina widdelii]BBO74366.1 hypothetical protein DSCW_17830 [Desulfosarcina widdelii]
MSSSQRGKVAVELSRTLTDFSVMADSGDHQRFNLGALWSGRSGYEPDVRPNGIVTGQRVLSPNAANDTVTVAAFTAYSKGVEHSVAAGSQAVTRPSTENFKISSIIMTDVGGLDEVEGTEGTEFSETRGAAGGPPLIPEDAVELGQVRMNSQSSAVIAESEIYQAPNDHAEYADIPGFEEHNVGKGSYAEVAAEKNAHIKFNTPLPAIHTGPAAKRVYIKFYTPSLTVQQNVADFKPAEMGVTKSSTAVYEGSGVSGAIGSMKADSVGDASFTLYVKDGITDGIVREKNQTVTVKWWPDANKLPYMLTQGLLAFDREFPSGNPNKISCTIYCEKPSVEFSS